MRHHVLFTLVLVMLPYSMSSGEILGDNTVRRLPPASADNADASTPPAGQVRLAQYTPAEVAMPPATPTAIALPQPLSIERSLNVTGPANNFTAFPEFDGGITIGGESVAMKIGGYIKADLIKDFNAIESSDSFDTTSIPTHAEDYQNARMHARQSRLSFDTRWK
ncbi:MAG: hypothetical protein KDB23_31800, partial [Planctomycetales bacterium]|nr:hypothetical protein [Planctomycetales bacterium]